MPCYEAPPPWSGAAKDNAEDAVRILCALIGASDWTMLPDYQLKWYLVHREIDLMRARDVRMGGGVDAKAIECDIARLRELLGVP